MNELQTRVNSITQILAGDSSKVIKVVASLRAFSGLDITHFDDRKTKSVYKYIATLNTIMGRYPAIKTDDDYNIMSEADLDKILKNVQQLCIKLLIG